MRWLVVAALALAGCTYDEKILEGPFTCVGESRPTTAPETVHFKGKVFDGQNTSGIILSPIDLQNPPGMTIRSTSTDLAGEFSFDLTTQGVPVVGFNLHATAATYVDSYYFPPRPIAADVDVGIVLVSSVEKSSIFSAAGLTETTGDGHVLLRISDCLDVPVAGATLTSSPANTVRYFTSLTPSPTSTETDGAGVAMVANLPPGKATLTATAQGHVYPPVEVTIVAGAFTVTDLQP